jgi:hypothetical protein
MKKLTAALLFIGLSLHLSAQAKIKFIENSHDFGSVQEGELAIYVFQFKNTGNDTLQLQSVRPSCGCTSPYWAKDPVLPGQTGEIKVQYNSKGRPGPFNKSINIVSNAAEPNYQLKIRGVVVKPINSNITKDSIALSAEININKKSYVLGEIEQKQKESFTTTVENTGKSDLKINKVRAGCGCIYLEANELMIPAGTSKKITISINPNELGKINEIAIFETNDPVSPYYSITVQATVKKSLRQDNLLQTNPGSGF